MDRRGPGRDRSPGLLGPGWPPGDAPGLFGGGGGDPEPYGLELSGSEAWHRYGGDGYADTFGGIASGLEQHYDPGASSYLNGAPEDPRAVDRELGRCRRSYQEWLELGHVYVNGRRVEIRDLPGRVSHGGGRSPAQVEADTERARGRIAGYLNAGAGIGGVKAVAPVIEPKPPLTRERLGDTFILDGAKVETEGFLRLNADFPGGRSPAQVRQRKRLSDGLTIREMQEHYDQSRIMLLDAEGNPAEKSGHVYYPLPSGDSMIPLPVVSLVQPEAHSRDTHSPGGKFRTGEEHTRGAIAAARLRVEAVTGPGGAATAGGAGGGVESSGDAGSSAVEAQRRARRSARLEAAGMGGGNGAFNLAPVTGSGGVDAVLTTPAKKGPRRPSGPLTAGDGRSGFERRRRTESGQPDEGLFANRQSLRETPGQQAAQGKAAEANTPADRATAAKVVLEFEPIPIDSLPDGIPASGEEAPALGPAQQPQPEPATPAALPTDEEWPPPVRAGDAEPQPQPPKHGPAPPKEEGRIRRLELPGGHDTEPPAPHTGGEFPADMPHAAAARVTTDLDPREYTAHLLDISKPEIYDHQGRPASEKHIRGRSPDVVGDDQGQPLHQAVEFRGRHSESNAGDVQRARAIKPAAVLADRSGRYSPDEKRLAAQVVGAAGGRKSGAARRARVVMLKKPKPVAPQLAGQGRRRRGRTPAFDAPRLPGRRRIRNPIQNPRRRRN